MKKVFFFLPSIIFKASKDEHRYCIQPFLLSWATTILPVVVAVVASVLAYRAPNNDFLGSLFDGSRTAGDSLLQNLQLGRVFIYASSYLAPAIIVIWKYNDKGQRFNEWYKFVWATAALALLSAVMFMYNSSGLTKNLWMEIFLGVVIYMMSVFYWYGAILHDQQVDALVSGTKNTLNKRDGETKELSKGLEGFEP